MALNAEQAEALQFVSAGHNLLITGQAGVGKSRLVASIVKNCDSRNLKVAVFCSSGIACTVYGSGLASTVHSFYGLGTADLPAKLVLERSMATASLIRKIQDVDVIIWDEASMFSSRILEIVNTLHHHIAGDGNLYPFGGKQLVLVGEFLQLRPVPSRFDDREFMFNSFVFSAAVSHRIQLTRLMRQLPDEVEFAITLQQIRFGKCMPDTANYFASLSRELDPDLNRKATHIFFRKAPTILHNRAVVDKLPGESIRLKAEYEGETNNMKWPGEDTIILREGAKAMLVWNKTDTFKNGSMGVFVGMDETGNALVRFEKEGTVKFGKETWTNTDHRGQKIGSVCQYPIVVAYAITCHKSQGLTLDAVVVHCANEFVAGLIYVSSPRVRSASHMRMLNFKPNQLLKQPQEVIDMCSTALGEPLSDLSCCRHKKMNEDFFKVTDRLNTVILDSTDDIAFPAEQLKDRKENVLSYYEIADLAKDPVELRLVYDQLQRHESQLAKPPSQMFTENNVREKLQSLKKTDPRNIFAVSKNQLIDKLISNDKFDDISIFINIMWFRSFQLIESHVSENGDEFVIEMTRENFTKVSAKLHEFFGTPLYHEMISGLFEGMLTELSDTEKALATEFSLLIHWELFEFLKEVVKRDRNEEPVVFDVEAMDSVGKAKARHVGGWAVKKLLKKSRKYVMSNMYTENSKSLASVKKQSTICEIIEENLVASYSKLEESSLYRDSLQVTESRQFRNRGLIHITDNTFLFFMSLEQQRVFLLNDSKMKKLKGDLVTLAHQHLLKNENLRGKWFACFDSTVAVNQKSKGN